MHHGLAVKTGELREVQTESINMSFVGVPTDNPTQIASVAVAVKILDVNDNPPSLTQYLEAYMCENAKAGQVRRHQHETLQTRSQKWRHSLPDKLLFDQQLLSI